MPSKRRLRRQDVDPSDTPLIVYPVGRKSGRPTGPIPEFLAKKQAERAPKTYEWYRDSLTQLWEFLEQHDLVTLGQFGEHAVHLFRLHLREKGVSENTVSNRLQAIKAFARWLAEKGWTDDNVLKGLKAPQSVKPRFDLISDEARAQVFAQFQPNTFLGSRNLAILAVLSDTGLRREEVANLLLKNVDLDAHVLKVYSDKTEEWRYVPLTDEAAALIRNYLKWRTRFFAQPARHRLNGDQNYRRREPRQVQSDRLFLTWAGKPLKPQVLAQMLERAGKRLGFRVHAHHFRHDWITRKALDGESPSVVKRWAGHKSYVMTDYYFGLAEELLGAIQPKRSVLAALALPGVRRRRLVGAAGPRGSVTRE